MAIRNIVCNFKEGIIVDKTQKDAIHTNEKSEVDFTEYYAEGNKILNRMKKAILNKKGIRLSAEEMQFISNMQIGAIILDEDADPNHKTEF